MHDTVSRFLDTAAGLVLRTSQAIPSTHMDALRIIRDASLERPAGNFERVASLPVVLVERWAAEGFDVHRESAKAIVARLRAEHLDAFVTTKRRL